MKKFIPIIAILILVGAWGGYMMFQDNGGMAELKLLAKGDMAKLVVFDKPKPLPETGFLNRAGELMEFSDLEGKATLLNIWATWCEPCREEMPTLKALQTAMAGENFQIITMSVDWQGYKVIDPFLAEYNVTELTAYWDKSNRLPAELEVIGLPLTVLISKDGEWLARLDGPAVWNSADAIAVMKKASEE